LQNTAICANFHGVMAEEVAAIIERHRRGG
jgi:hypothetical protein